MTETNVLVVGASVSGLAVAGCLEKAGLEYEIIEKQDTVAWPWRHHYDRLHLHTNKNLSALPYRKFPKEVPRYPSRNQVVAYLDQYNKAFGITPHLDTRATSIQKADGSWVTETNRGTFQSRYLVVATGPFGDPRNIRFPGMETFPGEILHSRQYKTGKKYQGQDVLVVGFGNSACEIAIDLFEQGARPSLSVRSPVNVLPRDVLGIPVLQLGILAAPMPPGVADTLFAPVVRLAIGNIRKLGLKKLPYGPLEQIQLHQSVPLLDIGTLKLIRKGHCPVYDDIGHIDKRTVYFKNGRNHEFDTIVAAIGYNKNVLGGILHVDSKRIETLNHPMKDQQYFGEDGLYFCGFYVSPTGQFREIARDAKRIVQDIRKKECTE